MIEAVTLWGKSTTYLSSVQEESIMRKSTVFISAVLTTFAIVMLYRVVLAYRDNQNTTEVAAAPTATPAPEPTATEWSVATEVVLAPEAAAQLAAQVVGNTSLLSAESSSFNGVDAYKIVFTNNDVVYVGLDGQVLAVQVAPVVINVAPPTKHKNKNRGGDQNVSNGSEGGEDHERDENHEEEEQDD